MFRKHEAYNLSRGFPVQINGAHPNVLTLLTVERTEYDADLARTSKQVCKLDLRTVLSRSPACWFTPPLWSFFKGDTIGFGTRDQMMTLLERTLNHL